MKKAVQVLGILLLMVAIAFAGYRVNSCLQEIGVSAKVTGVCVLVDPGHGNADPGKVGVNDVLEKDINLSIGNQVARTLKKKGIDVIQTRTTDGTMADVSAKNQKISDMRNRVELINKSEPDLVVSIHQNSYTSADVRGAQVFYHGQSKEGERAAQIMQKALLLLDDQNTRKPKANESYYMLNKTKVPTIIVECGFLSNPQEADNLTTPDYQKKAATAICNGIIEYLGIK